VRTVRRPSADRPRGGCYTFPLPPPGRAPPPLRLPAAMLTGRESLVRLIGRRRRSPLPASLAAVLSPSSPFPAASTAQADDGGGSGEAAGAEAGPSSGGSGGVGAGAEWVSCPVCGESIRGSDYCVNTHLGAGTNPTLVLNSSCNVEWSLAFVGWRVSTTCADWVCPKVLVKFCYVSKQTKSSRL